MWMTLSSNTIAAKGSKFSKKGLPIAQPIRTIRGSTNIAICATQCTVFFAQTQICSKF